MPGVELIIHEVDSISIDLSVNILDFGGHEKLLDCGVYWSEQSNPEISGDFISLGEINTLGLYQLKISDLEKFTRYYLTIYTVTPKE